MDQIRVGLDFGTHQTKICIQRTPDEGHGEPIYEFFKFKDLEGNESFFLPSIVQVNSNDTISYGFVDKNKRKRVLVRPVCPENPKPENFNVKTKAYDLFYKYANTDNVDYDVKYIRKMLEIRKQKELEKYNKKKDEIEKEYIPQLIEYRKHRCLFEYFKQATLAERDWYGFIDCKLVSIWYLSYIIFELEERYGTYFSINMGVPADFASYNSKKETAISLLVSAYNLVENVFENDFDSFLSKTVDELKELTEIIPYSIRDKEEFGVNVFPEAYACILPLTSKGKLAKRLTLTIDIGGGTTDISFFSIIGNRPRIFKYWSIPHGLNYISEQSGFDYREGDFAVDVNDSVLKAFNKEITDIYGGLRLELVRMYREKSDDISQLNRSLKDLNLVYNGGGSVYEILKMQIGDFNNIMVMRPSLWKDEIIVDKDKVLPLCQLLSTAFGLCLEETDTKVDLNDFGCFLGHVSDKRSQEKTIVDKDMV